MAKNGATHSKRSLPLPQLVMAIGLVLCLIPLVKTLWIQGQASQLTTQMTSEAQAMDPELAQELFEQARSYNAYLAGRPDLASLPADKVKPYEEQLQSDYWPAMAWIEIPTLNLKLAVNHGDDADALATGVGHFQPSSLPVGGAATHCWLEGHSGSGASLFDPIRQLEAGDLMAIHVLDEEIAYKVTSWEIVKPEDISAQDIAPVGDSDLITLITCTTTPDKYNPKGRTGINDRRLLVHGERCEYDPEAFGKQAEVGAKKFATYVNEYSWQALLAVLLLAILLLITFIKRIKKARSEASHK